MYQYHIHLTDLITEHYIKQNSHPRHQNCCIICYISLFTNVFYKVSGITPPPKKNIYGHFFCDLHYGILFFHVSAWLTLTFFTQCYCTKVYIQLKEWSTIFYKHFRLSLYTVRSVVREKSVTYITGQKSKFDAGANYTLILSHIVYNLLHLQ